MPQLTFLGTGTSNGVPMIGCTCEVCSSRDPKDWRNRSSVVVRWDDLTLLVDTATELRLQARMVGLAAIDAVLMTHPHADHTGGLDDLRRFNELQQRRLPVFANQHTGESLVERYGYAFTHVFPFYGGKPDLDLIEIDASFEVGTHTIIPIPVLHGRMLVFGYRFGDLAYITDAKTIPESSRELLRGVDTLVINALREREHPTHLTVAEALDVIADISPRRAYLTHLSHDLGHAYGSTLLPPHVQIAYDGLVIESAAE